MDIRLTQRKMAESGKPVPNEIIHASDIYSKDEVNDLIADKTRSNLLRPSMPTKTSGGITCTNNGDGTFTINGTAAENAVFILAYVGRMSGYKLTGCPTNNSGSYLAILRGSIDEWSNMIMDTGNGVEISLDTTSNPVVIAIEQGLTVDNVVFKPMITNDLSATYDDFVSYNDSFITGINNGIKLDLLWTNADPTSGFASQILNIDVTKYKLLAISFRNYTYYGEYNVIIMPTDYSKTYYAATVFTENKSTVISRGVNLVEDKLQFYDGYVGNGVNNNAIIPFKVYGIE